MVAERGAATSEQKRMRFDRAARMRTEEAAASTPQELDD
jgi:hypothetical protein